MAAAAGWQQKIAECLSPSLSQRHDQSQRRAAGRQQLRHTSLGLLVHRQAFCCADMVFDTKTPQAALCHCLVQTQSACHDTSAELMCNMLC
jgi:hypothetical protein